MRHKIEFTRRAAINLKQRLENAFIPVFDQEAMLLREFVLPSFASCS
jgi:hypothetical protein